MNGQENERFEGTNGRYEPLPVLDRCAGGTERRAADLVVDLTGISKLDLTSLSLLLTAQQQAREEDREVWLAGVPAQVWAALDAMGLGRLFKPFPVSAETMI